MAMSGETVKVRECEFLTKRLCKDNHLLGHLLPHFVMLTRCDVDIERYVFNSKIMSNLLARAAEDKCNSAINAVLHRCLQKTKKYN
jgi:hypothetical protein